MNEDSGTVSQMRAITVSREYGSGGGEIAQRLARHLNWQLIDHEVVLEVARELGVSEGEANAYDERVESMATRILNAMQVAVPMAAYAGTGVPVLTDPQVYHEALRRVVEGAVVNGHVVIVGRGSQVLLAGHRDILHVRIVAPLEQRVHYVMQREGFDAQTARSRIHMKDRDRIRYLQEEHNHHPAEASLYDLTVNTAVIDLDGIVELIDLALKLKAKQLNTPLQQLGPSAGLTPYPGKPDDFRVPKR